MLDFEQTLMELEERIQSLKNLPPNLSLGAKKTSSGDLAALEKKYHRLLEETYGHLTPWQKVQVARHLDRPRTQCYIQRLVQRFVPLAGDRCFGNDVAVSAGMGLLRDIPVMIIGHEKGTDTPSRLRHNFGMAHPEGYRKAIRLMDLAQRFNLPVVFFIDTPGAYAGTGAEERGQAQAIAECIDKSLSLTVPVLSVIIGEGGSGGAVAFGSANYIAMLEHSVYSVISPEGCASILWHTAAKKEEAALNQKLTAQDLKELGIVDEIIPEPMGGAQRDAMAAIDAVGDALQRQLKRFSQGQGTGQGMGQRTQQPEGTFFKAQRREKFLAMGRQFVVG